jgi:hypothetical protein
LEKKQAGVADTTTPPELYLQGKPAGRVTANKKLPPDNPQSINNFTHVIIMLYNVPIT